MPTYGLTPTGFVPKTQTEIRAELEAAVRAEFGTTVSVDPEESFLGQLIGILAEREALVWDLVQEVDAAFDPDEAEGVALDEVAAITGTTRQASKKSTVRIVALGTAGTVLEAGRVASVAGAGHRFATTAAATLAAPGAWTASTAYAVGDYRTNGGNVYRAIIAGVSAAAGGPTGNGTEIVDGTVTWRYIGTAAAMAEIAAESEEYGAIAAPAGTLNVIETPQSGWDAVTNPLDATMGRAEESDTELRIRREDDLHSAGYAVIDAIRSEVLDVDGVSAVRVFENTTLLINADGMPPKSIEALVSGGLDADVRAAVFRSKPGGIESHGTNSGAVTDSDGITHTIKFSRPTEIAVWLELDLTVDAAEFPSDGATRVRDALIAYGQTRLVVGKDVVASALIAQAHSVPGVLDAEVRQGTAVGPTTAATIPVGSREIGKLDTARITITTTAGTP